ncbi:MAG TPA: GNAT family protein [Pirellulales bacterium]|jgi:ribosomal-protein-alanine N-acetyltransferase|nr:GNAT family protein [Pirellulales bacterium]
MNLTITPEISLTEFLRPDLDALVKWLSERGIYERTLRIPHPYTLADAEKWLTIVGQTASQNGRVADWAIRDSAGWLIGGVGLECAPANSPHRAEIGYWLAKPFWGRGIMTAVVATVCRHAFETLGFRKITAHVFSFNDASARVLEKCGFEPEGYLRQHLQKDGLLIDIKLYGLLKDSFLAVGL